MCRWILAAAILVCALAAPNKPIAYCDPIPRIIGGVPAESGEFPFQVSIKLIGSHRCGGAIINEEYIVTAAHCADFPAHDYTVEAGSNKLGSGSTHKVSRIIKHPSFAKPNDIPVNDIALFKLSEPLTFGDNIQPVDLPEKGHETPAGTMVTITGWGATQQGGSMSDDLMTVDIPIVSKEKCNATYAQVGGLPADQICAGFEEGGMDSCQGDSGGPLTKNNVLVGIVSWGYGCAKPGYPGVYTEVSEYIIFINSSIL